MARLLQQGLVVGLHGHHVVVETPQGQRVICHARGKKNQCVVGDRVQWLPSTDEGTIEKIEARRNLLYRQDSVRSKQFAANLDLVLFVLAAQPVFSENQLARALIACADAGVQPVIVLNKSDLTQPFEEALARLAPYQRMGYTVLTMSTTLDDVGALLMPLLAGKVTFIMGASGVGKSSLINRLLPQAHLAVREISTALNSGKHTTTTTTWCWLDESKQGAVIDSPGFQEFGLHHVDKMRLAHLMPDFAHYAGQCRFYNCTHLHEPQCAVLAHLSDVSSEMAADAFAISPSRHAFYARVFEELSQSRF